MIDRVLVANRGEIARRIIHTCRRLGIGTVAVYSDPDAGARHVAEADLAVRLPGAAPADTYLRTDLLVAAAAQAGADAVHPGYGFRSEDAGFAAAVTAAGLTWIGPPPASIAAAGSKVAAKQRMAAAGVPVLPELDPGTVTGADFPLLVKASAGGGGRGMRAVHTPDALPDALASARREAGAAFGDPTVFCEPLLTAARHIEVQVLADAHGTVWTLGERECSIQRRHQKIVEETPSPAVDDELRRPLFEAASRASRAIGYVGAGTVEFMLTDDGRFFFLEFNTRLQVEHPVTECVYGVDLVRYQLEIAEGAALPATPPAPRGHAIEVRLYAEDPAAGWRPQHGRLHRFRVPGVDAEFAVPAGDAGLRLDSGVVDGDTVGVHYDPMLAKLISWQPSRAAAGRRLVYALSRAELHGLTSNRELLVGVLGHPAFTAGRTDTGFLDRYGVAGLAAPLADPAGVRLAALAAALAGAATRSRPDRPLSAFGGWRNLPSAFQRRSYDGPGGRLDIRYRHTRDGVELEGFDGVTVISAGPDPVLLAHGPVRYRFTVAAYGEDPTVYVDSALGPVTLRPVPRFAEPVEQVEPGSLLAPMPGTVTRVAVQAGDRVRAGQPLLWLEAMKMEHVVAAPAAGVVAGLAAKPGQQVELGAVLAVLEEVES